MKKAIIAESTGYTLSFYSSFEDLRNEMKEIEERFSDKYFDFVARLQKDPYEEDCDHLMVDGLRYETDREISDRLSSEADAAIRREEYERVQYELLKKKFEGDTND